MTPTVTTEGASRLTVGDVECETLKDVHFSVLRRTFNIPDDFLDGTFDFGKLSGGGGKGGDLMSRTTDSKFFVKELNRGDSESLLRDDFLQAYVNRVTEGSSLLCKIVAVFDHPLLGRFMAMANCLPAHVHSWSGLYDLKGSADDKIMVEDGERVPEVHKRCWNVSWMLCEATGCNKGVPISRQRYLSGKRKAFQVPIYLTKEQKEEVMFAVKRDVTLFTNFHLMDYSMIVGVYHPPPGRAADEVDKSQNILHGKAYASQHGGNTMIVYFGIIDFLQAWTGGKRCAHVIKSCFAPPPISTIAPPQYARQFEQFFAWKLRGVAHPLPPPYANVDPASGSITGLDAVRLAAQVEELKSTVALLHDKLDKAEMRVEELENEGGRFEDARSS